jgi:hypothetical protein
MYSSEAEHSKYAMRNTSATLSTTEGASRYATLSEK